MVCTELHTDPWRALDEWTWARFWMSYWFVRNRMDAANTQHRQARVAAGLEKPRLVDALRSGQFGGMR